jgi:hypothetical protein
VSHANISNGAGVGGHGCYGDEAGAAGEYHAVYFGGDGGRGVVYGYVEEY